MVVLGHMGHSVVVFVALLTSIRSEAKVYTNTQFFVVIVNVTYQEER